LLKNFAFLYTMSDTEQLKIRTHSLAMSRDLVENIFLKAFLMINSSDLGLSTDLLTGHTFVPYSKFGKHLVFSNSVFVSFRTCYGSPTFLSCVCLYAYVGEFRSCRLYVCLSVCGGLRYRHIMDIPWIFLFFFNLTNVRNSISERAAL